MANKPTTTMDDIAALAEVSKPTVSRALSGSPLVNAKTRERILAIARKHGYAVNSNARRLRQRRSNTIGVSIDFRSHRQNHISDPFMFELLAGLSEALGDRNQDLFLTAPKHNDLASLRQILLSRDVDGFLFLGQGHREDLIEELVGSGAPLVVWGADTPDTRACVVGSDNFLGGQLAGRHFLAQDRRQLLFIGGCGHAEIDLRKAGLEQVAAGSGQSVQVRHINLENFADKTAYTALSEFLDRQSPPPDAIFAHSDTAAMACIRALHNRGLRVPEDVSVVGYNDIPAAGYFHPPVTTIRQDTHQAGALLVQKLLQILDGEQPHSEHISTKLIVRGS